MWQSRNRNDVARDIEEGKREGRYKDCANLTISGRYLTSCEEDSLRYPQAAAYPMGLRSITEPQCPEDCRFFRDRGEIERETKAAELRAKAAETRASVLAVVLWPVRIVRRFLAWYGKAPWQTQVLLLLVVLGLLAPRIATAIGELLKAALHGK